MRGSERSFYASAALVAIALAAIALPAGEAKAQSYPSRPVRFIVYQAAGGTSDVLARTVGQKLADNMGQQVVIENRPGANGILAMELGAKAVPDGYTIVFGASPTHAINPGLYKKLSYDPVKDFAPISLVGRPSYVIVVNPAIANSIKEFIALAKSKPGQLNYGAGGSNARLGTELFNNAAGVKISHVPYKSNSQALTDLMGGRVDLVIEPLMSALPSIQAAKLKPLAVTSPQRLPQLPDVPTLAESGISYTLTPWAAIYAPAGVPRDIIMKLNGEVVRALKLPDVIARFNSLGFETQSSTPEELGTFTRSEIAEYARLIKEIGIPQEE